MTIDFVLKTCCVTLDPAFKDKRNSLSSRQYLGVGFEE